MQTVQAADPNLCSFCLESIYAPPDLDEKPPPNPYNIPKERLFTLYQGPCHATHRFHWECVKEWYNKNHDCPLCRSPWPEEEAKPRENPNEGGTYNWYTTPACEHAMVWEVAEKHLAQMRQCPCCELPIDEINPTHTLEADNLDQQVFFQPGCVDVLTTGMTVVARGIRGLLSTTG